jgi:hypothetical protein
MTTKSLRLPRGRSFRIRTVKVDNVYLARKRVFYVAGFDHQEAIAKQISI